MNKFKIGDRVRIIDNHLGYLGVTKGTEGTVLEINVPTYYVLWDKGDGDRKWHALKKDLVLANKTLYTLEVGDVVVDTDGEERTVVEVLTQSVLLSNSLFQDVASTWFTFKELEKHSYTIKDLAPVEETITIDGKSYKKSEVEEKIKELKEVQE